MKTHQQRRTAATRSEDAPAVSTEAASGERGGEKTCKVAVPDTLHAATKVVAARRGRGANKLTVQDLVAECLRGDTEIAAEETALMKGEA